MGDFNINIDLGSVMEAGNVLTKSTFPRVHQAIGALAEETRNRWVDAVKNAPGVWIKEKDTYAASIKWEYTGDFSARIYTDYDIASLIENGRPARDLKVMLNTSMKVRRTESGKRFLVIPIQHNTHGNDAHASSMPAGVEALAAQLAPSRITGTGQRPAGQVTRITPGVGMTASPNQSPFASSPGGGPAMVPQHNYQWGGRLKRSDMAAAGMTAAERKRYGGMVRFDTAGAGKIAHSTYLTFRIMMEGSPGWIVPAKPGLGIVSKVRDAMAPISDAVVRKAAKMDFGI